MTARIITTQQATAAKQRRKANRKPIEPVAPKHSEVKKWTEAKAAQTAANNPYQQFALLFATTES